MKKSSLFISALLTTFILAVVGGAITAYRSYGSSNTSASVQQPVPIMIQPTEIAPAISLTPQEAAQIAAQYLGQNDLYSVESVLLNGMTAFKVTFSSGIVVYVSPEGQILSVIAAPTAIPQAPVFHGNGDDDDEGGDDD